MAEESQREYEQVGTTEGEELKLRMKAAARSVQDRIERADERIRTFVNERPLTALAVALGLGYVAGRIAARLGREAL